MERGSGDWFHHWHKRSLLPNLNLPGYPFDIGWLNTESVLKNPHSIQDFHQAFAPVLNSASKEKFIATTVDFNKKECTMIGPAPTEKRFLVFDQSGGETTLLYSSGFRPPVRCGTCAMPKPHITCDNNNNVIKGDPRTGLHPLRPVEEHEENYSRHAVEDESEMREDTEELNALLYSDSDSDNSEEDEEASTGHSPSIMTDNGIQDFAEEKGEEVDSCAGSKRQKLLDGSYDARPQKETQSSLKTNAFSGLEGEVSTCHNSNRLITERLASSSGRKRKERMQETLSIMQSIFPSLHGKGGIDAIDEAIHFLRSLKMKAKALGLNTL